MSYRDPGEGLTREETAAALGLSLNAVRAAEARALYKLRRSHTLRRLHGEWEHGDDSEPEPWGYDEKGRP